MRVGLSKSPILLIPPLCLLGLLLMRPGFATAEQLPIKTFTTADGLARDQINRIVRDSHGFLWFCTEEGLSRFDGYKFTNYTTASGLPHRKVNDLLETRSGVYWVATGSGVCRFNPAGSPQARGYAAGRGGDMVVKGKSDAAGSEPMFVLYHLGEDQRAYAVYTLIEDHTGTIWCGTDSGVYRLEQSKGREELRFVDMGMPRETADGPIVMTLLEDRRGALWAGFGGDLYRRWPDGRTEFYPIRPGFGIKALIEDRTGHLWVGATNGLFRLVTEPVPNRPVVDHVYTNKNGLTGYWVQSLYQSSDGRLWAGTNGGLSEFIPTANGADQKFRSYTSAHGLSQGLISALTEDRDGNLWIGSENGGAMKMARNGFTSYSHADGLGSAEVASIVEDQAGALYAISAHQVFISRFDGQRFVPVQPDLPKRITYFGWGWNQITFQDHTGEWWVATGQGLCRFPRVSRVEQLAHTRPKAVYTRRNGLIGDEVFRLFEDSRGDIWITTTEQRGTDLTKWERATETFRHYSEANGAPPSFWAISFCEDTAGNLWTGGSAQTLVRYASGRFTAFTTADGVPLGWVRALYLDHLGRLWIATGQGGLARIDDTGADHPRFVTYTTAEGLSSNQVNCLTEDRWGRLYLGTGRGMDRLDPATGHIKHYTAADGLIRGEVEVAFRDRQGALWFGSQTSGLSRLIPEPDRPQSPPPILISRVRIAGVLSRISELGETAVSPLTLEPNQNDIQIDFVGLGFGPGEALRYQYRLEGADQGWSALTDQRAVNYANLPPGAYRFLAQAVSADGLVSPTPATVAFRILPPVWRRWWFQALTVTMIGLITYTLYRYRMARLIELERVRTRIASDLHDDIGSNLSLIAGLSEVLYQQARRAEPQMTEPLLLITEVSHCSVDAMSDIVWAVNPKKDHLRDLIQRMRRFASDAFTARHIELHFEAPDSAPDIRIGAEVRREVFLIFKEAVNNIVRHSGCTLAEVGFEIERGTIQLRLRDNGKGFDPDGVDGGQGLVSMRQRAEKLGGELVVISQCGQGSMILIKAPLRHS
jgi:ligand-binding sensor domain-containing protein/two-component sensor histidine kinase